MKFADGVKLITPAAVIFTVPLLTAITWAVPGVRAVPPIETMVKVSPSGSLSKASGFRVTVASSATV
ncbi:hypothetical protein D3C86_2174880 [compost metagenome]